MKKFTVVAPGRVNVIGEHIDHQGFGVLPCTIDRTIRIQVEVELSDVSELKIRHLQHEKYRPFECRDFKAAALHSSFSDWYDYIRAVYIHIAEYCPKILNYKWSLTVSGNVPIAVGLSSSSALSVAAYMAFAEFSQPISLSRLAVCVAQAERYIGVSGGGMDQAIILMAKPGYLSSVNFNPIQLTPVKLPSDLALVVANTGREAPKAVQPWKFYNLRVFELHIAKVMLTSAIEKKIANASEKKIADVDEKKIANASEKKIADVDEKKIANVDEKKIANVDEKKIANADVGVDSAGGESLKQLLIKNSITPRALLEQLDDIISPEPLNRDQAAEFYEKGRFDFQIVEANDEFHPYRRVKHVLSETVRVDRFIDLCKNGDASTHPELGELMNQSGHSLDVLFDCSCPEIRELCDICLKLGAYGARLTGAGWGGCVVALIPLHIKESFIDGVSRSYNNIVILFQLVREYYEPYKTGQKAVFPPLETLPESREDFAFATTPGGPAHRIE